MSTSKTDEKYLEACDFMVQRYIRDRLPEGESVWTETWDLIAAAPLEAGRYLQKSLGIGPIMRNAIKCDLCDAVLESKHRHDFAACECGTFTDGGTWYARRGIPESGTYTDMSAQWPWVEDSE